MQKNNKRSERVQSVAYFAENFSNFAADCKYLINREYRPHEEIRAQDIFGEETSDEQGILCHLLVWICLFVATIERNGTEPRKDTCRTAKGTALYSVFHLVCCGVARAAVQVQKLEQGVF